VRFKKAAKNKGKEPKNRQGSAFEWPLIRRIITYTRPYRIQFYLALGLTLLGSVLSPAVPSICQYILDGPTLTGDVAGVRTWVMLLIGVLLLQSGVMYANTYVTGWLGQSIIRDIRLQVYNHIISLRTRFFDTNPVGMLQTRTISDVETLNEVFSQGLVSILGEMLTLVFIFGVMLATSWKLTLVVLTTVPVLLIATSIFKNAVKVAFQNVRKYVGLMNAFLQEHITGMLVIQIFNREETEHKRFQELNQAHEDANLKSVLAYSIFFPVVEIVTALATALLVWYGVGSVLEGQVTFGTLVAFLMYINMFFRPIRMLADRFNTLQMGMVSAGRIFQVLDDNDILPDTGNLTSAPSSHPAASIRFEHVWFAYKEENWVLKDLSFNVQPGQKVAFVGSTGAGKSTIINLLSRLYDINRGTIFINDTDIRELKLESLRGMIGLVLQDVFLFSGTIYENITLNNPNISQQKAEEAAKLVGADRFIRNLPDGYLHQVQERGASLSAGQRQLIAFARVLVYNPQILILDEATSSVDTESEELIQKAIETVMQGRTSIIVAHRLSTIQKADQIMVMEKGRILESGTHTSLLAQSGMYHKLYTLQFAESLAST
jgi:ATP-binding cassette subfamily B protein